MKNTTPCSLIKRIKYKEKSREILEYTQETRISIPLNYVVDQTENEETNISN